MRLTVGSLTGLTFNLDWPETFAAILYQIRLPHTLLVALTGAALAGSGAAYQGLFRNPLADPYLIGAASGAGLGAVIAMSTSLPSSLLGSFAIPAAAFVGSMATEMTVYMLSRTGRIVSTTTLILAGVAMSSFTTAVTSFLMIGAQGEVRRALSWLLGGSVSGGWQPVIVALPYMIFSLGALGLLGHILNVLQFGDEQASQLGMPVERARIAVIVAASLATAAAVSFSGIIGFIGLIIPHIVRILWGPDYRGLIPLSVLGGATALLLADLVARLVMAPEVLPVGVITALAGAPFFIWVLRRSK
jgi:iron complex transport system permease protein